MYVSKGYKVSGVHSKSMFLNYETKPVLQVVLLISINNMRSQYAARGLRDTLRALIMEDLLLD